MPTSTPSACFAADRLAADIANGRTITAAHLQRVMDDAHGGKASSAAWSWRHAYDGLEAGLLLTLPSLLETCNDDGCTVDVLTGLLSRLPTHTRRSEQQIRLQQFSTPVPYAFVAARAAKLSPADLVLEPSAGIGALAIFAKAAGARLIANELDPERRKLLSHVLGDHALAHDGALIDDLLSPSIMPTVVLMNPPFSSSKDRSRDRDMAANHVVSAMKRLAEGGRLVAILPSSLIRNRTSWWSQFMGCWAVRMCLAVDGRIYRKHGTQVETALVVADKVPADESEPIVGSLADLAEALPILDRLPARPRLAPVPRPVSAGRSRRLKPRRRRPAESSSESAIPASGPLDYRVRSAPAWGTPVSDLYVTYELQRIALAGARPHPTPLVESVAMASVAPPVPSFRPMLPPSLIDGEVLSEAQLETVIYAGEAHSRLLPGRFVPNETGETLWPAASGSGSSYRTGYFLGDGTGCGKGRQVAAVILANVLAGRRRALWISKSETLIEDAIRDWTAVGGRPSDIRNVGSFKPHDVISMSSGILFVTYATLRAVAQDGVARLQQILDWLGDEFDGVIAFDEAHAMANAASAQGSRGQRKPSLQGLAGLRLQNALPDARVLYVSATGASSVASLAYASRLGLWLGLEAPFPTRDAFTTAMHEGGVAAMEVVARDLKALGLYAARSLSFTGVEYDVLDHRLTAEQRRIYDCYADAFQVIHANLTQALEATNVIDRKGGVNNAQAKSAAHSRFESLKQRFFNHLITGMKMPTLIDAIHRDRTEGASSVVQLVSTGEAMLDRRLAALKPADLADPVLDLTPREYVMTYLMEAFPTALHRVIEADDGSITTELVTDSDGHPVQSREALAARDRLVEEIALLAPVPTALDQLLWTFGADEVAEITGRSKRPLYQGGKESQKLTVQPRSPSANASETMAFQQGDKRILVFSGAGGTGRSYHADRHAPNQDRRHHHLLEPGWRADEAIQGLGRSHRSNQAVPPLFRIVTSDVAGEKRFTSTIARRLDALGALTKGQRQTGGQGMFRAEDNMESPYALQALRGFYRAIAAGEAESVSLDDFETLTGLTLTDADGALLDNLPPMPRLLNRMLAIRLDRQAAMFDELFRFIGARIQAARQAGILDLGVEVLKADGLKLMHQSVLRRCPRTQAETVLSSIERRRRLAKRSAAALLAQYPDGWPVHDPSTDRVALRVVSSPLLSKNGTLVDQVRVVRPTSSRRITETAFDRAGWASTDRVTFARHWDAELARAPDLAIDRIHLLSGLLLPVWTQLPSESPRVYRVVLDDGQALLGRVFDDEEAGLVRARLDPTEIVDPASLLTAVLDEGRRVQLLGGAMLAKRSLGGEARLEIEQPPSDYLAGLKALGCFTEMVDWRLRLFIPIHDDRQRTLAVLEGVLDALPPA